MNNPSVRFMRLPRIEYVDRFDKNDGNYSDVFNTNGDKNNDVLPSNNNLVVLVLSAPKNVNARMKLRKEVGKCFKQIKQCKFSCNCYSSVQLSGITDKVISGIIL